MSRTPKTMRFRHVLGVGAAMLVVASCAGPGQGPADTSNIKVGVLTVLSGPNADGGTHILNAGKLAAAQFNKAGGVNGRKLEVIAEDDQCDAQVGAQAAEKVVAGGAVAVAGGYCSGATIPEVGVLTRHSSLPYVVAIASNPKVTQQGYDNVFRIISADDVTAPVQASFMIDYKKFKRIAILHDNSTFGKGLADAGKAAIQSHGGADIVYFDAINPGQQDYSSNVTKIASLKPDVLLYTAYYAEAAVIAKEIHDLGLNFAFMGTAGIADPQFIKVAGPAANGVTLISLLLTELTTGAQASSFKSDYKSAYGVDAGTYDIYEYDAMMVLGQALKKAGSTKPADLRAALKSTNYTGLTGQVQFGSTGDRSGKPPLVALTVANGQFAIYATQHPDGSWSTA